MRQSFRHAFLAFARELIASPVYSGIQQSDIDLFTSINASIPDIPVRGNRYGDFTGVVYNTTGDPDCWWSATHCVTPAASAGLHNDTVDCNEANTWGFTLDDGT